MRTRIAVLLLAPVAAEVSLGSCQSHKDEYFSYSSEIDSRRMMGTWLEMSKDKLQFWQSYFETCPTYHYRSVIEEKPNYWKLSRTYNIRGLDDL